MKRYLVMLLLGALFLPLTLCSCEEKKEKKKDKVYIRQETTIDTEKGVMEQKTEKEYKKK